GGADVEICEVERLGGATWGEDGHVVFSNQRSLWRVPAAGGEPELLLEPAPDQDRIYRTPSYLPGAEALLVTLREGGSDGVDRVAVLDLASGDLRELVDGSDGAYAASGHLVYAFGSTLRAVGFDLERRQVVGEPVAVLDDLAAEAEGHGNFSLADSGALVYVAGPSAADFEASPREVVEVDREGNARSIGLPPRSWVLPRFSPDGKQLALVATDEERDLWTWDLERRTLARLTFTPERDRSPVWMPDGRSLVYQSERDDDPGLYRIAADGSGRPARIGAQVRERFPLAVSPDGRQLLYRDGEGVFAGGLGVLDLEGGDDGRPLLDSPRVERAGKLSPDGRWLAYDVGEGGLFTMEVFVRPFPDVEGARIPISAEGGGGFPQWSPAGDEIYFVRRGAAGGVEIVAVPVDTSTEGLRAGTAEVLFSGDYTDGWDVSPVTGRFLMIRDAQPDVARRRVVLVQNWLEELKRRVPRG
ncbi:MAG: hypothetical protein R3190_13700, partial [Thermoanaerobaculia bacterium]|nr:hypothetical protein [Thermoanaerobaculia bacterium]